MAASDDRFCEVKAPFNGKVWVYAVTTANRVIKVPSGWLGKEVEMNADGVKIYLRFGPTNAIIADPAAVTTTNAGGDETANSADCCGMIAAEGCKHYVPRKDGDDIDAFFAVRGTAAGSLRCHLSEHPVRD